MACMLFFGHSMELKKGSQVTRNQTATKPQTHVNTMRTDSQSVFPHAKKINTEFFSFIATIFGPSSKHTRRIQTPVRKYLIHSYFYTFLTLSARIGCKLKVPKLFSLCKCAISHLNKYSERTFL